MTNKDDKVFIPYNTKSDLDEIDNHTRDVIRWYRKGLISSKGYHTIMECMRSDYQYVKKSIAKGEGFWVSKQCV